MAEWSSFLPSTWEAGLDPWEGKDVGQCLSQSQYNWTKVQNKVCQPYVGCLDVILFPFTSR